MTEEITITISPATPRHLYTLAVLSKQFFSYAGISFEEVKRRISSANIKYFIAELEGRTVGFADYEIEGARCKLMGVAVLPEHRGRGVARKLVETVVAEAAKLNCERVYLLVADDNLAAISLYRSFGFDTKGTTEKKLSGKNIVVMEKQLKHDRSYV